MMHHQLKYQFYDIKYTCQIRMSETLKRERENMYPRRCLCPSLELGRNSLRQTLQGCFKGLTRPPLSNLDIRVFSLKEKTKTNCGRGLFPLFLPYSLDSLDPVQEVHDFPVFEGCVIQCWLFLSLFVYLSV